MEEEIQPVSATQLMQLAEQLSSAELGRLAREVTMLNARRKAPVLGNRESALFATINEGLSDRERLRLVELGDLRYAERLTPAQHSELLELQEKLESLHTARIEALGELAQLRGISLIELMNQLGIQFPDHG
jgi:hypothetical protein